MTHKVDLIFSHKEPNKEQLWLRPRKKKEGYDILYYSSKGWRPLIDTFIPEDCSPSIEEEPCI